MRTHLPLLALAALLAAGCSSSETDLSKADETKMKNWLEHGIPANKGGSPPATLPKNDPKTGTPTD